MFARSILCIVATLAAAAIMAGPASAQTEVPAPGATPGACVDHVRPTAGYTSKAARRARRTRLLRGTARDAGCGVDRVQISVARKHAGRCRALTSKGRLGRPASCGKPRWLAVKGTTKWSFRMPKRLGTGTYQVRTRAVDFAGNVQRAHTRRLKLR